MKSGLHSSQIQQRIRIPSTVIQPRGHSWASPGIYGVFESSTLERLYSLGKKSYFDDDEEEHEK